MTETDVAVIGGGPAGLATALALARSGQRVIVLDKRLPPIDKACGEGLMPDGLRQLRGLGVELDQGAGRAFHGIRYIDGKRRAEARFAGDSGLGIRRPVLHERMAARAAEVGIETRWGTPVDGIDDRTVVCGGERIEARWVVGADGLHSRVRRWLGLQSRRARFRRFGMRRHHAVAPWSDLVEVYWADGCEAYVTPVSESEVGVALLWSGFQSDFDGLMERFPELRKRLEGSKPLSRTRGAAVLEQRTRAVHVGPVALVGDAAGYRDAITGEGMSLAFHQAVALAAAIDAGDLGRYERAQRRLTRLPYALIRVLLELEARPRLRRRLVATLAAEPDLFARLLAIHSQQAPLRSLGGRNLWRLLRGLCR